MGRSFDLEFRTHAIRRMAERDIEAREVRHVIENGQRIEKYPDDEPYPSELLLGWSDGRPIHVVAALDRTESIYYIITVYEPDPDRWSDDFTERREE